MAKRDRSDRDDARERDLPATEAGNSNEPESAPDSKAWQKGQTGKLSGAGWGSESAGGSVVDKRPPENKPNKPKQQK